MHPLLTGAVLIAMPLHIPFSYSAPDSELPATQSPDGRLIAAPALDEAGRLTYGVTYDGKAVLGPSPLGLNCDNANFCAGLVPEKKTKSETAIRWPAANSMNANT